MGRPRVVARPKARRRGSQGFGFQRWGWGTSGTEQSLRGPRRGTEERLDEAEGSLGNSVTDGGRWGSGGVWWAGEGRRRRVSASRGEPGWGRKLGSEVGVGPSQAGEGLRGREGRLWARLVMTGEDVLPAHTSS